MATINNKKVFELSSGYKIPAIGFGTYFKDFNPSTDSAAVEQAVKVALQTGYRHLDCAIVYETEPAIGKAIKASGVPREEIFITSKLWNTHHDPVDVEPSLDQTLKDLDVEYVDLYLIHWPQSYVKQDPYTFEPLDENGKLITNSVPLTATWGAMEKLVTSGKARSIGVSNFNQAQLEEILSTATIPPAVNQIQAHPYLPKTDFLAWCTSKNIHITAWAPLSTNRPQKQSVEGDPAIIEIVEALNKKLVAENDAALLDVGKALDVTASQVALSWGVQRGTSVIPKSANEERIKSNFKIIELPEEVMVRIDGLKF